MDNFYLMQNLLLFDSTGYFEIELSKKRLKMEDLFKVNSEKMISQMNLGLFQKKKRKTEKEIFSSIKSTKGELYYSPDQQPHSA